MVSSWNRATRCVFEKVAQNESQSIYLWKLIHSFPWKKCPNYLHICIISVIFTKIPKIISHTMGKNSPNLVTQFWKYFLRPMPLLFTSFCKVALLYFSQKSLHPGGIRPRSSSIGENSPNLVTLIPAWPFRASLNADGRKQSTFHLKVECLIYLDYNSWLHWMLLIVHGRYFERVIGLKSCNSLGSTCQGCQIFLGTT
jgi:hypothetical protein